MGMTYGQLFMKLNPNVKVVENGSCVWLYFDCVNHDTLRAEWWNKEIPDEALQTQKATDINSGKWTTYRTKEHDGEWYCSKCGYEPVVMSDDMKYCPGCGRKMTMPEPPKEG